MVGDWTGEKIGGEVVGLGLDSQCGGEVVILLLVIATPSLRGMGRMGQISPLHFLWELATSGTRSHFHVLLQSPWKNYTLLDPAILGDLRTRSPHPGGAPHQSP